MAVFDTNIVIDYLNGYAKAKREFESVNAPAISIITWMEVLIGVPLTLRPQIEEFFQNQCELIHLDEGISRQAICFRIEKKMKLLDAIVLATAYSRNQILVTRDNGFDAKDPMIRIPYKL